MDTPDVRNAGRRNGERVTWLLADALVEQLQLGLRVAHLKFAIT